MYLHVKQTSPSHGYGCYRRHHLHRRGGAVSRRINPQGFGGAYNFFFRLSITRSGLYIHKWIYTANDYTRAIILKTSYRDKEANKKIQPLTTGNRAFAESKSLWREPPLGLSAKNSSPRVKKILGEDKNSRWINSSSWAKKKLSAKNSSPRANQLALGEEILRREVFLTLGEEFF
jgi:hypothetical protein